jgi:hypothetical protein
MADEKPREHTREEIEKMFYEHVWHLIAYWNSEGGSNVEADRSSRERLEGVVFSIFTMLDGCGMPLPRFIVAPNPHSEDRDYHIGEGENYFPEQLFDSEVDLGGTLHELFYNHKPKEE